MFKSGLEIKIRIRIRKKRLELAIKMNSGPGSGALSNRVLIRFIFSEWGPHTVRCNVDPDPVPASAPLRILIQEASFNLNPDPHHCLCSQLKTTTRLNKNWIFGVSVFIICELCLMNLNIMVQAAREPDPGLLEYWRAGAAQPQEENQGRLQVRTGSETPEITCIDTGTGISII